MITKVFWFFFKVWKHIAFTVQKPKSILFVIKLKSTKIPRE